jgi:uncharacterized membrane protein (DUF485 family)
VKIEHYLSEVKKLQGLTHKTYKNQIVSLARRGHMSPIQHSLVSSIPCRSPIQHLLLACLYQNRGREGNYFLDKIYFITQSLYETVHVPHSYKSAFRQVAHTLNILITYLQPFTPYHQVDITSPRRLHTPFKTQGNPHPIALLEISLSKILTSCYVWRVKMEHYLSEIKKNYKV